MICVYVVVELKELVVEVLVGDGRLRAKYPRLVPGSSSQNTIRLHQILLHLVIDNIRLRQFLVFEYLWLLLITTFAIIVSILAIESVWIIFLFSNFYEEVVFGSTSNATRPAVESKFLWWPSIALVTIESAIAFHGAASVRSSFYLHERALCVVQRWPSRILQSRKHLSPFIEILSANRTRQPNRIVSFLACLQLWVLPYLRDGSRLCASSSCCCWRLLSLRDTIVLARHYLCLPFRLLRYWRLDRYRIIDEIVDRLNITYGLDIALNIRHTSIASWASASHGTVRLAWLLPVRENETFRLVIGFLGLNAYRIIQIVN